MNDFSEDANRLADVMLDERRALVAAITSGERRSTEDLRRLAIIEETIALAGSIRSDEITRSKAIQYEKHREAGTLDHDDFRDVNMT